MRYTTTCDVIFGHFGLVAGQTIMVLVRACRVASERGMDKENLELKFYEASTDNPYHQHTLDTWFKYRSMSGRGSHWRVGHRSRHRPIINRRLFWIIDLHVCIVRDWSMTNVIDIGRTTWAATWHRSDHGCSFGDQSEMAKKSHIASTSFTKSENNATGVYNYLNSEERFGKVAQTSDHLLILFIF